MQSGKCTEVISVNGSSRSTKPSLKWAVMMPTVGTVEAILQAAEVVVMVAVVIDLWDRTSVSSVAGQDTGPVIARQLAAVLVVAEVAVSSHPAPGLVAVGTAMRTVNVMWMIDMMEGVLGIEIVMTVERSSMVEAVVAILMTVTGTQ